MTKISHQDYLERKICSKKLELEQLRINHRINIAVFEVSNEIITKEINSLELQLSE